MNIHSNDVKPTLSTIRDVIDPARNHCGPVISCPVCLYPTEKDYYPSLARAFHTSSGKRLRPSRVLLRLGRGASKVGISGAVCSSISRLYCMNGDMECEE